MQFKINYRTNWGENVAVRVEGQEKLIMLNCVDGENWEGDADIPEDGVFRYCIVRDGYIVRQEMACAPHYKDNDGWREPKRVAGIAVPVFSLRSSGSQGVGDFGDLKMLVDWAEKMGLKAIQILPINDTTITGTWKDSYPYNSISTIALHPMYFDLRQVSLPKTKECDDVMKELKALNELAQIDYEKVNLLKRKCIQMAYDANGDTVLKTKEYKEWFENNKNWLVDYAAFRVRAYPQPLPKGGENKVQPNGYSFIDRRVKSSQADIFNVRPFGEDLGEVSSSALYYYTQYMLHCHLKSASDYARQKGIILKGDIPIGVSRDSVEVVTHPALFNMDMSTGAPPDAFSEDGQIWGFPTYNWEEMAKDGYQWWKQRMQHMAQYFTAYRIDHILGFFRIWSIPARYNTGLEGFFSPCLPLSAQDIMNYGLYLRAEQLDGLFIKISDDRYHPRINGHRTDAYQHLSDYEKWAYTNLYDHFFYHRHNQFWYEEAMKKLPALTASNLMICCGEDLGMVPACVPWVMRQLNILSLEIQTMPKDVGVEFGNPAYYPSMSVCTISSHDTATMRGWWEEDRAASQRYYNNVLGLQGEAPEKASGWICERIISSHLASPSILCILTLQDWLSVDEHLRYPDASAERINVPANSRHYWRYRMHLNIDDLMNENEFNNHIKQLVTAYGRDY